MILFLTGLEVPIPLSCSLFYSSHKACYWLVYQVIYYSFYWMAVGFCFVLQIT